MGWLRDTFGRRGGGAPAQPPDAVPLLQRGAAQLREGELEPAAESLERAIRVAGAADAATLSEAHHLLGRAQLGLGRIGAASMSFEAAVRARPDFPEALDEGARVLQELDE